MDLGLHVVYGRVVFCDSKRYVSGYGGTVWTDTETTIHALLEGVEGEQIFYIDCDFPVRRGHRVGIIRGKTSALGLGKVKCLGIVDTTSRHYFIWDRRWLIPLVVPILVATFLIITKACASIQLWDSGKYLAFVLAGLPSVAAPTTIDKIVFALLIASCYPAYKMIVWRRITRFVISVLKN